ncbi:hypothetical protein COBT_002372 [Conglomerata obtusa]
MEILKKTLLNIDVSTTTHDKNETIHMDAMLSKNYTIGQIIFYIQNINLNVSSYLEKCKNENILPVSITDTKNIINAIENYVITTNTYLNTNYLTNIDFSYILKVDQETVPKKNMQYNILVSESVNSLICTKNAYDFIFNNKFIEVSFDENLTAPEYVNFKYNGDVYVIRNDAYRFTSDDWERTVCIFVDGDKWQFKRWFCNDLIQIFNNIPTFYVFYKKRISNFLNDYAIKHIEIDDNKNIISNVNLLKLVTRN